MSNEKEFQVGDIVQLKSGGAEMTIQKITPSRDGNMAFCVWHEKNKPNSKNYPIAVLKHCGGLDIDSMLI